MAGTDREAELTARLAALEAKFAEMEARAQDAEARARDAEARAAGNPLEALDAVLDMVLPAEARVHLRAARRERLLAVRALVDSWIERTDRAPTEPKRRQRRESIPLDDA